MASVTYTQRPYVHFLTPNCRNIASILLRPSPLARYPPSFLKSTGTANRNAHFFTVIPNSTTTDSSETENSEDNQNSTPEVSNWPTDWTIGNVQLVFLAVILSTIPIVPWLPRFQYSASVYFGFLALWAIYVGSHGSLKTKQVQSISLKQSLAVPILCSVTLFSLYTILKLFPDLDFKLFFSLYLNLIGSIAVGNYLSNPLRKILPGLDTLWTTKFDLPEWLTSSAEGDKPVHVSVTATDVLATSAGVLLLVLSHQPWAPFTVPNFVAVCIAVELLQLISLGSFTTASIMLIGLLLYDIFWVFGSSHLFGDNVMVKVATSQTLDGPMKLIFPNFNPDASNAFSILGLGDIAAPGLFVALMLRFDRYRWQSGEGRLPAGDKTYFLTAILSYVLGLALTIGANVYSGEAQPALLYLVPCLLGGISLAAVVRSETATLWGYKDSEEESNELTLVPQLVEVKEIDQVIASNDKNESGR